MTILEIGMNVAVPYAASILAEMGADVWKVEPPGGDTIRAYAPLVDGMSTLFATLNREKRYLSVDLKSPAGRDLLAPLVEQADVVLQNFRPRAARTLGVDALSIHAINPAAVHVSVEAFYPDGVDRPGLDLLVQAESGFMDQTGVAGGEPCRLPASIIDYVTGMWVAMATMSALGGPRDATAITVTMMDVALSLLGDKVSAYLATGEAPQRMGSAISTTTPHQAFRTSDGYVVVGAPNQKLFEAVASVVEPGLVADERFATSGARLRHRAELVAAIEGRTATDTTAAWVERLGAAGVPTTAVNTLSDAVANHQLHSPTGVTPIAGLAGLQLVNNPLDVRSGGDGQAPPGPGRVGRDTDTILRDSLGLDVSAIDALAQAGAIIR